MFDKELVREILSQILIAANRIERRSAGVGKPDDFLASDSILRSRLEGCQRDARHHQSSLF